MYSLFQYRLNFIRKINKPLAMIYCPPVKENAKIIPSLRGRNKNMEESKKTATNLA